MNEGFLSKYSGTLIGLRHWSDWDDLMKYLDSRNQGQWYVYYLNATCPQMPLSSATFSKFIEEMDKLLHADHDESYLGIIYVDNQKCPELIKIYDPNNLGSSCGCSGKNILPGWIISLDRPADLSVTTITPEGRNRWWRRILS
ncbi:hypothetical protein HFU84_05100 [Acidithiobacillus sp. CV18-2]|nr:hypothetical protein [Acidithiobacillus sp. MC6.1]MBU2753901.1 hypothetical protein [Acidithiobacillus sp. CV18-3]MBU2758566.1 hypothetical protein [Acidithiobacillus sp. BN09-2]MBU2761866.1 hypothetical protein [Acidithiobacillus caldus]MBU2776893.1 hypothetical protein [Acidithiobacillus sp. CV18-2]MBU2800051.1 hypothetical protein [Acidithiobacillus sp. VAN18-4]